MRSTWPPAAGRRPGPPPDRSCRCRRGRRRRPSPARQRLDIGGLGRAARGDRRLAGDGSRAGRSPAAAGAGRSSPTPVAMRSAASTSAVPTAMPLLPAARQSDRSAASRTSVRRGAPAMVNRLPRRPELDAQPLLDPRQVAVMFPVQQGKQALSSNCRYDPLFGRGAPRQASRLPGLRAMRRGSSGRGLALRSDTVGQHRRRQAVERIGLRRHAPSRTASGRQASGPVRCTGCSIGATADDLAGHGGRGR